MKRATIITALLTGLTAAVVVAQVDFVDVPHTHPHREAICGRPAGGNLAELTSSRKRTLICPGRAAPPYPPHTAHATTAKVAITAAATMITSAGRRSCLRNGLKPTSVIRVRFGD